MTPTQSKILAALLDGELSRSALREKSGVASSTSTDILKVFIERGLIINEPVHASPMHMYSITPKGKKALRRFEAGEPDLIEGARAESRTVIGTERNWVEPTVQYVRNEGHKHIGSYGNGC